MLLVLCGQEPKKKEQIIDETQKLFWVVAIKH